MKYALFNFDLPLFLIGACFKVLQNMHVIIDFFVKFAPAHAFIYNLIEL